jgi:hypothetical protein
MKSKFINFLKKIGKYFQTQSDLNVTDVNEPSYVKNRDEIFNYISQNEKEKDDIKGKIEDLKSDFSNVASRFHEKLDRDYFSDFKKDNDRIVDDLYGEIAATNQRLVDKEEEILNTINNNDDEEKLFINEGYSILFKSNTVTLKGAVLGDFDKEVIEEVNKFTIQGLFNEGTPVFDNDEEIKFLYYEEGDKFYNLKYGISLPKEVSSDEKIDEDAFVILKLEHKTPIDMFYHSGHYYKAEKVGFTFLGYENGSFYEYVSFGNNRFGRRKYDDIINLEIQ